MGYSHSGLHYRSQISYSAKKKKKKKKKNTGGEK